MITIVPARRLLWLTAVVVAPLLTIAGLFPDAAVPAATVLAGVIVFAAVDAVKGRKVARAIDVIAPPRLNLFMGRRDVIEMRIRNPDQRSRAVRVGLNFPPEFTTTDEDLLVTLPSATEMSSIQIECTPTCRGRFDIPSIHLESESPARLWNVRKGQKLNVETRVYPDLLTERKSVSAVFMRRRAFGARVQRQIGKGRDFEKLREYLPGDSFEDVHWKATAKRGHLITKIFQIERTQEVYIAIDCSRLTNRPSSGDEAHITVLDRFVTCGLVTALAAEQHGDHFGLITFSDHVHSLVRARSGRSHFGLCRDTLFNLAPRLVTPDFEEFFSTIRSRLRKRALIIVLTALDDPILAESFTKSLELVSRQHLLLVNMIEPCRVEPMFKTPAQTQTDVYEDLAGQLVWQKLREIEKMLALRGVRFSVLPNEKLAPELINQYLEVKQRQIL